MNKNQVIEKDPKLNKDKLIVVAGTSGFIDGNPERSGAVCESLSSHLTTL